MLIWSQRRKILELLADAEISLWRFSTRGDLKEPVNIAIENDPVLPAFAETLQRTLQDGQTRFLLLLGDVGAGKTHFFWRASEHARADATFVYVPAPPGRERLVLHVYTQLMEVLGIARIRDFIANLTAHWGGYRKVYGIYRSTDMGRVIKNGIGDERTHLHALAERELETCIRMIVTADMDMEKKYLAERWILGELMDFQELELLGVDADLRRDETALVMLQLILTHLPLTHGPGAVVFFFDELEKVLRARRGGTSGMDQRDGMKSFATTGSAESPRDDARAYEFTTIVDVMGALIAETRNAVVVGSCITAEWPEIREFLEERQWPVEGDTTLTVPPFAREDFLRLMRAKLQLFWDTEGVELPALLTGSLRAPEVLEYFPFARDQLLTIFQQSGGNPRQALRLVKRVLYNIVYDDEFDFARLVENLKAFTGK